MIELFAADGPAEEGGDLRHEEARVDERPAPEPACPSDELVRARHAGASSRPASRRAAELAARRDWYRRAARPAQGARAHDRRHRAAGGAVLPRRRSSTTRTPWRSSGRIARRPPTILARRRARRSPALRALGAGGDGGGAARAGRASGFGDKAGKLFQPLRVALTGLAASPGIFDVLLLLGRDRSLARIDAALSFLRSDRRPERRNKWLRRYVRKLYISAYDSCRRARAPLASGGCRDAGEGP